MTLKGKTVLIVDDEPFLQEIWVEQFEELGAKILTANNGASGVKILRIHQTDLVLTDLRMPGSDGTVILNFIKMNLQNQPPLTYVCSGFIEDEKPFLAEFPITKIIAKPFDIIKEMSDIEAALLAA